MEKNVQYVVSDANQVVKLIYARGSQGHIGTGGMLETWRRSYRGTRRRRRVTSKWPNGRIV